MRPRVVRELNHVDAVTAANAALGTVAVLVALGDPTLAGRLILAAALADGIDGILARRHGPTDLGELLDSLADVVSFGVAPAVLAFSVVPPGTGLAHATAVAGALFVVAGVVRLGLYVTAERPPEITRGVPTTLAATLLAAGLLFAGLPVTESATLWILPMAVVLFAILMLTRFPYPDLTDRDAALVGTLMVLATALPFWRRGVFPATLVALSAAYLLLAPRWYRTDLPRTGIERDS
jgi:archaetidylserine synthase